MVHDGEGVVDLVQSSVKLLLCYDERRSNMHDGSADPHKDTVFDELLLELEHGLGVGVLEQSLNELAILANEIKGTEETSNTALSEAVVFLEHLLHALG